MARRCLNCEDRKGLTRFRGGTFTVGPAGQEVKVKGLSGWRCGLAVKWSSMPRARDDTRQRGTHWCCAIASG